MQAQPKCSCKKQAPRCDHCKGLMRKAWKKFYAKNRERLVQKARDDRAAKSQGRRREYFKHYYAKVRKLELPNEIESPAHVEKLLERSALVPRRVTWLELSAGRSNT